MIAPEAHTGGQSCDSREKCSGSPANLQRNQQRISRISRGSTGNFRRPVRAADFDHSAARQEGSPGAMMTKANSGPLQEARKPR